MKPNKQKSEQSKLKKIYNKRNKDTLSDVYIVNNLKKQNKQVSKESIENKKIEILMFRIKNKIQELGVAAKQKKCTCCNKNKKIDEYGKYTSSGRYKGFCKSCDTKKNLLNKLKRNNK